MAFSRDYRTDGGPFFDQTRVAIATKIMDDRVAAKCPKCKHPTLHVGPHGLYCERGDCEWEQDPGSDEDDG